LLDAVVSDHDSHSRTTEVMTSPNGGSNRRTLSSMEDREYWDTCENCAWSWGPGPEEEANAAALEHQEQTGHQAHASAGEVDTRPPSD
jgi:hypothetical protein